MCSIIGYSGKKDAAPILVRSLGKMEYRGYDSVGIATKNGNIIDVKKDFAKFVVDNLDGITLREFGPATDYVGYQLLTNPPGQFKQYKIGSDWNEYQKLDENQDGFKNLTIYGETLDELVENGKKFKIKYIIAKEEKNFYPFLSDLYSNEENYPYMVKIFDSNEFGYKKLKVKVFQIDYEKFNNNN